MRQHTLLRAGQAPPMRSIGTALFGSVGSSRPYRLALGALLAALGVLGLLATPSAEAATKQVAVTPTLHVIKGVKNGPPHWYCYDDVVAQWEAWETATAWNLVWVRNGQPGQAFPRPPFNDDSYVNHPTVPSGAAPPEGYHWYTLNRHSGSSFSASNPPKCDVADSVKSSYSSITMYITVDENDPGPDGDDPPPPPVEDPPPPTNDKLTPTEKPPPPDEWPFDARRSTVTLVDCEPGPKASAPHLCTAAVWDAHPDDPDASAPTGDVVWFAPTGKLGSGKRCTLKETTAAASTCAIKYTPSSKTYKDPKQPVQGGYQGSKVHRPSSGLDGERPIPLTTAWKVNKKKKKVGVSLYCGGGKTCKGEAALTAKGGSGGEASSSAKRKKRTLKLGSSRYRIKPGRTKRVTIELNRKGRAMLRQSKRAKLRLTPSGGMNLSQKVPVRLVK